MTISQKLDTFVQGMDAFKDSINNSNALNASAHAEQMKKHADTAEGLKELYNEADGAVKKINIKIDLESENFAECNGIFGQVASGMLTNLVTQFTEKN